MDPPYFYKIGVLTMGSTLAEASVNEIEKIEIEMTGYFPEDFNDLSDYIPAEDDRRFIVEGMK